MLKRVVRIITSEIFKRYIPFFSTGTTTHCGFVFCSPVAGYSLLAYEVSWSHTTTRHSR